MVASLLQISERAPAAGAHPRTPTFCESKNRLQKSPFIAAPSANNQTRTSAKLGLLFLKQRAAAGERQQSTAHSKVIFMMQKLEKKKKTFAVNIWASNVVVFSLSCSLQ